VVFLALISDFSLIQKSIYGILFQKEGKNAHFLLDIIGKYALYDINMGHILNNIQNIEQMRTLNAFV